MLIKLWDLLDTPIDEKKRFEHVTSFLTSSIDEVSRQGSLGLDVIEQVILVSSFSCLCFEIVVYCLQ